MDIQGWLGLDRVLEAEAAERLVAEITRLWIVQTGRSPGSLRDDLELLKRWFDPVASGERLRREVGRAPRREIAQIQPPLIYPINDEAVLVTPEGRVALDLLEAAIANPLGSTRRLLIDPELAARLMGELLVLYTGWCRQRLDGVVGLLTEETATLRPGAAGLLIVLLINRNTSAERAVPRPRNDTARRAIEYAIGTPAMAWTQEFTGRAPSGAAVDLYRGWAIGELARRLGPALHLGFDGPGIFIDESAVETAVGRLVADLERRPSNVRERVPASWAALLESYRQQRPVLASLGVAFELPSVTRALGDRLLAAAGAVGEDRAGGAPTRNV